MLLKLLSPLPALLVDFRRMRGDEEICSDVVTVDRPCCMLGADMRRDVINFVSEDSPSPDDASVEMEGRGLVLRISASLMVCGMSGNGALGVADDVLGISVLDVNDCFL
jgi:hypothetical protein